ncbi:MAG: hypothetical protein COY58_09175 [Gammaproteobacteria bacterium CG_4_10_14_0_8_um_filter_38_16]|nr:MAG: hypothetical protein COY58_09175 [Gammaproteobacteria bacterium CG_4_10_14_0_8_um_filter_38_16]PJA04163.1 MAG: hypothetical protein COX72_01490 [Gammaproteobacteria bacterium CG_4_10_14_0_2_um_filter_38_22]PJB10104.1 MAG: hypothetical protein CO120_06825 [Gammaproteobacteria bacterium CG_4_9_14_3_um_filter_38_9]
MRPTTPEDSSTASSTPPNIKESHRDYKQKNRARAMFGPPPIFTLDTLSQYEPIAATCNKR